MEGYDVKTIDGDKIGHVVDTDGDFLIVEHGLLKSKHALPKTFAEVDADERVVRTSLSKHLIYDSPKINGELDRIAVAEHYGLAEGFTDPPTRGLGDLEPDDPAWTAEQDAARAGIDSVQERVTIRQGGARGEGPNDEAPSSPGVTGGDRRRDYPKD
jgi:hypothetical protein